MTSGSSKRVAILDTFSHYVTSFVVLLKGIDKLPVPGKTGYAVVLIVIGLIILFGTIFHHRFERTLKHFKGIIYGLEAITMTIVGYLFAKDGKEMIQYVCYAAAAMFLVATIIYFTKRRKATPQEH
ncbi:MAG TPA: hypothetical protein VGD40_01460 [Chryseosolibacter sp.]